uniref:Uncharacterized protein n=1 Tax=Picea glauca TaxID=3330 RepID=A0A101M347_PICGL|nr:hypothetical protein ABT39_MTgene3300 [Picea glauca]
MSVVIERLVFSSIVVSGFIYQMLLVRARMLLVRAC